MSELQYLNIQFALLNPTTPGTDGPNVKGGLLPIGHASALAHQNGWLKDRDRCLEMTTTVFFRIIGVESPFLPPAVAEQSRKFTRANASKRCVSAPFTRMNSPSWFFPSPRSNNKPSRLVVPFIWRFLVRWPGALLNGLSCVVP